MLIVYAAVLFLLGVIQFMLRRRVARLEKVHTRYAGEAEALLKQVSFREGNGNRPDPYQAAKRQYELGRLADKRDSARERLIAWQNFTDRFVALRRRLRSFKGKTLPYLFGALDVVLVLTLVELFVAGSPVSVRTVAEQARALYQR
jgi:hypothetical protein